MMFDPRAANVMKWGCSECKGEEFAEQDTHRYARNCEGAPGKNLYFDWDPNLRQCPWSLVESDVFLWVNLWQDWERWRVLPFGGSDLMAYPAYFHQAFTVCETARVAVQNETQERQIEKQKAEAKKAESKRRK